MAQRVVGREAELAVGEAFLDAVPSSPVALILEGEAGIGKTTVWRELVEAASHRSYRVLSCQPAASEAKLSYSGISDLLGDAADDVLPLLPAPQREALEIALLRAEPRKGAGDPRTTATALLSALHQLAREAPVVVAVDDVQWLDGPSARALEFAARRLGELPVALLISLRTPHLPGVPLVLDRAFPEERLHRTPVGPLTLPALHRLLKKRLGFAPPRPTLIQIERAAGGNPFFALELARALPTDGSRPPTGPLPVPETLRQVLEDRIARLPAATRAALLVASALSDATVALVESATDRADSGTLAAAEESGVIETEAGTVRFVHPLLSSLAYSLAPASERRRVHRRLGELVADVEQRARHLALSADGPDEEVAGALEQAGERAALRGAPDAAAELLEQARGLTPAERVDDAGRRTVAAAEFHFHAGDRHRARVLLEEVLGGTPAGPVRADALRLLGELRYHDDSFPEAIALFEEALEHVEDVPRLTAPIELGLVYAFVGAVDYPGAEPHARRALEQTEALGEPGLLAQALAVNALVDLLLGRGLDESKLERALELEDVSRAVTIMRRPSMVAATLFFYSGQLERAQALYIALHERVIERGEESHLSVLAAHMAWLHCWRGDFDAAAQIAGEGLEASMLVGSESMQAFVRCFHGLVRVYQGDVEGARSDLDQSLAIFGRTRFLLGRLLGQSFRGLLELSLGNAAEAHSALAGLVGPFEVVVPEPFLAHFVPDEIEALVALGDIERAEALLEVFETGARRHDRAWALAAAARCRGLIEASRGDYAAALTALEGALAEHERAGVPVQRGRTLLVKGRVHRRNKEKRAARESLEQALSIFDRLRTPLWADQARADLSRVGLRPPAPDELTATEQQVAELAASGLTNRKIAETVFMTPKSVEAVMARIYRKLGISSRAELATAMGERRATGG